jgi:multidrug resistance efflux pump
MNAQPRRTLTTAPDAPDEVPASGEVVVSGGELLERIERLSAQLGIARAQLSAAKKRAAARSEQLSQERDELLAANADLTQQLEAMWFQLRAAERRATDAEADASKGLLRRLGKRQ